MDAVAGRESKMFRDMAGSGVFGESPNPAKIFAIQRVNTAERKVDAVQGHRILFGNGFGLKPEGTSCAQMVVGQKLEPRNRRALLQDVRDVGAA